MPLNIHRNENQEISITAWRVLLDRELFERQLKRIFTDRDLTCPVFKGPHTGCQSETRRTDNVTLSPESRASLD
jgi:hypothetical protein